MRSVLACILYVLCTCATLQHARAQDRTIYKNKEAIGFLKQTHVVPTTYIIESISNQPLVTIYPGKALIRGKQYYILTFWGDNKRAALQEPKTGIDGVVSKLVQAGVLTDAGINSVAKENFTKAHPLPKGYPDAELLNEYGKN